MTLDNTDITAPRQHRFAASGAQINWYEWNAPSPDAPSVLMLHATGFHARCWDKTIAYLPAGTHVIAVDMRGHGFSENVGHMKDWTLAATDIVELLKSLGHTGMIGVGHSFGGHTLTQVAARMGDDIFSRLVLVDPVIQDPATYQNPPKFGQIDPEHMPIAKRRNHWKNWREMFDRFAAKHPYNLWRMDVLEDYCRYGIVPADDGNGFVLGCPPIIEASIYLGSTGVDIIEQARGINVPVTVLRALRRAEQQSGVIDFSMSPTWEKLSEQFPQGRDVYLPQLTHFIPMQAPDLTARYIMDAAA